MNKKLRAVGIAISLVAAPVVAEEPFTCKEVSSRDLRVYRSLGLPVNKVQTASVKVKKGAVIVDEERAFLADWFKPEGGVGGVIPYKQPQIVFSLYLIDGQERVCSTQRHEDVFGSGEEKPQYLLRCLQDADGDGRFDTFHRHGELVSYNPYSGKTGTATGTPQVDHPLVQPLKLVTTEDPAVATARFAPILRSVVQILDVTKNSLTLRATSQVAGMAFDPKRRPVDDQIPSTEIEVPLNDGAEVLIGPTRVHIARTSSGWEVSAPDGFVNEAKLICGGTVLETPQTFTIFQGGGFGVLRRSEDAQ